MSGKRSRNERKREVKGMSEEPVNFSSSEASQIPEQSQEGSVRLSPAALAEYGERGAQVQAFLDAFQEPREEPTTWVLPNMVISEKENSFMIRREHGIKKRETPLGRSNGESAEEEVRQILVEAGLPKSAIFKSALYTTEGGEREVGDGLLLYGETAFMIQIKSRNVEAGELGEETKWGQKKKTQAYAQAKLSLNWLEEEGGLRFEAIDGSHKEIRRDQYNWVALVVLNYNEAPFTMDNDLLRVGNCDSSLPRVVIATHDLEEIGSLSRSPLMFISYLRKLQFQSQHRVGEEWDRLYGLIDAGVYPAPVDRKPYALLEFEKAITASKFKGEIPLPDALQLRKGLDYAHPDALVELQADFVAGLNKQTRDIRKDHKIINGVAYSTVYINSSKQRLDSEQLQELAMDVAAGLFFRYKEHEMSISMAIVVDRDMKQDESFHYLASAMLHREGFNYLVEEAEKQGLDLSDLR